MDTFDEVEQLIGASTSAQLPGGVYDTLRR